MSKTVKAPRIEDVRCEYPPGTTQGDLDRVAAHEQSVLDQIEAYTLVEPVNEADRKEWDAEWQRWIDAGRPDLVKVALATGNDLTPCALRIIHRSRQEG